MPSYDLGQAKGEIVLDYNDKGTKEAETGVKRLGTTFAKVAGGIIATAATIGGVIAGLALSGGISRALNIEDAQAKLKGLGHDAQSVEQIMVDALNSVRGTAFGLDEAATIAASAVAAGVKPGQELEKYLKLTADAATIAGSSLGDMGYIMNQVQASGRVMTEEINMLQDRGIPVLSWLAEEYGVTAVALRDMVSKGEVDAATFQRVIEENIGGAALASGSTTRGAFKNVGSALSRLGAMFVAGPITAAPALFVAIQGAVDRFAAALKPVADEMGQRLMPVLEGLTDWINTVEFEPLINWMIELAEKTADFVGSLMAGDFDGVTSSLGNIGDVIQPLWPLFLEIANAVGMASGAIGALVGAGIGILVPLIQGMADALEWLGDNSEYIAPILLALGAAWLIYRANQALATAAALASIPVRIAELAVMVLQTRANNNLATAMNILTGTQKKNTAVTIGQKVAIIGSTASMLAHRAASLALAAGQRIAAAAQWAMNAAMTANPIGIVIALIAALVGALIWFFTETELGREIWANFTAFLGEAWEWLLGVLGPIFEAIGGFFAQLWTNVTEVWNGIMAVIGAVVDWFSTYVGAGIEFVVNFIVGYFQFLASIVLFVWNAIATAIGAFIDWWMANVYPVIEAVVNLITAIFNFLLAIVQFVWQQIVDAISTAVQAVSDFIATVWGAIIGFITPIFEAIFNFISDVFENIYNFVVSYVNFVSNIIRSVWSAIIGFVTPIFQGIYNFLRDTFNNIYNFVSGVVTNVSNFISDVWNNLIGIVAGIFGQVYTAIEEPINDVAGIFEDMYDNIVGFFSDAGDWLFNAGADIIGGLIGGIEDGLGWLTDTLNNITNMIPQEKGPPSRDKVLLEENGGLIMQGLINGLRNQMPELQAMLGGITASIPASLVAGGGQTIRNDNRQVTYQAAPGAPQISGEEELFVALRRSKVVAGW